MAWRTVCTPKRLGGLGLKNLRLLNLTLRMRWRWLELTDDERPWQGLKFSIPREGEKLSLTALDCTVGNGRRLRFWQHPWMGSELPNRSHLVCGNLFEEQTRSSLSMMQPNTADGCVASAVT